MKLITRKNAPLYRLKPPLCNCAVYVHIVTFLTDPPVRYAKCPECGIEGKIRKFHHYKEIVK